MKKAFGDSQIYSFFDDSSKVKIGGVHVFDIAKPPVGSPSQNIVDAIKEDLRENQHIASSLWADNYLYPSKIFYGSTTASMDFNSTSITGSSNAQDNRG